ncbi:hypothetical protein LCL86_09740 [Muricauda ruestringensis]|uniref:hypothetical protein n=1 Tax=Flagellimonas ruestringensis TaxID=111501 RepID=UPI001CD6F752|nr:hypothetical protein [Allomuricauda ruestringensis]MCA0959324.1 hypothetical protein [Allomuricauda ruestringensis]
MKKLTPFYTVFALLLGAIAYGQNSFPASGTVGIGTLTPDTNYALDINGSLNATEINVTNLLVGGSPMQSSPWNLNGNNIFYSSGNVGIGTNTPNYELDIAGTLNATNILVNGTPLENSSSPWTTTGSDISFTTGDVDVATLNATEILLNGTTLVSSPWIVSGNDLSYTSGNIGIGTAASGYALDVAGTINATNFLVNGSPLSSGSSPWTTSGNDISYATGNVGIGTAASGYALDVAGTINATNFLVNGAPLSSGSSPWTTSGNDISYATGNVGIGTSNTQGYMFAVAGSMVAESVKVELEGNWPDFVFEKNYTLLSLKEVEAFINKNGHLPNVPSAEEIKNNGIDLGEMDATLLQKIEELTLHSIQQQKEIESLKEINQKLSNQNKVLLLLQERLAKLESVKQE